MKRVAILVATIAFTVSINTQVFATGVQNVNSTSPKTNINEVINKETGIIPDSMAYFIDMAFDNLKIFLTFDDAKKEEIISQIAKEKLAEYDSMTAKEKYDLSQKIIKDIDKLSSKLDVLQEDKNDVNLEHKTAVANMVAKRHLLNTARQEYQLAKVNLKQIKQSGDEAAIAAAQVTLDAKEVLYKSAKDAFKTAFDAMKKAKNDNKKNDEKIENTKENEDKVEVKDVDETNKIEEAKDVKVEEVKDVENDKNLTEQKDTQKLKVIGLDKKIINMENKNLVSNIEAKKAEHATKLAEIKKEIAEKLANNEIRHNNTNENDKKINEQNKEK